MHHFGDPCIHCGQAHDAVSVGNCAGNDGGLAATTRESAALVNLIQTKEKEHKQDIDVLKHQLAARLTFIKQAEDGLDPGKIALAETVLQVWGDYGKAGVDCASVVRDAIHWISGAEKPPGAYYGSLKSEYFGTKSYDHWHGQRCDCQYGMGPRHGSIIFRIGLTGDARKRDLIPTEREAAIYYLTNLERVQASRIVA